MFFYAKSFTCLTFCRSHTSQKASGYADAAFSRLPALSTVCFVQILEVTHILHFKNIHHILNKKLYDLFLSLLFLKIESFFCYQVHSSKQIKGHGPMLCVPSGYQKCVLLTQYFQSQLVSLIMFGVVIVCYVCSLGTYSHSMHNASLV